MITKIAEVLEVDYTLSDIPNIPNINERQVNGEYLNCSLPASFRYSGAWSISHLCTTCGSKVSFQNLPKQTYLHANRLFSKFYKKELLEALANIFPTTKVIKSSNSDYYFLTNAEFEGNIVSDIFIPQKTFAYYSCPECNSEYLCRFRHGHPIEAHRGNPAGKLGTIWIDEIIQIKSKNERMQFSDVLKKYRKTL